MSSRPSEFRASELVGLALTLCACGGCVSASLGNLYEHEVDSTVVEGRSKIILYVDETVDSAIHYYVYIDGRRVSHLFPGTFAQVEVDPGQYTVMAQEWWTGDGAFGPEVWKHLFSLGLTGTDTPQPDELDVAAKSTLEISVAKEHIAYIRITKPADPVEYFYPCASTAETITMCPGEGHPTEIRTVSAEDARADLQAFRESL